MQAGMAEDVREAARGGGVMFVRVV
jgi:hypothetical protein